MRPGKGVEEKICDKNSKALNKSVMLNKGGSENLKKANT